jgi:chromosome segregation ATPase
MQLRDYEMIARIERSAQARAANVAALLDVNCQLQMNLKTLQQSIQANEATAERVTAEISEIRIQTERMEREIRRKESDLELTANLRADFAAKYDDLVDGIADLERQIANLQSVKQQLEQQADFASDLADKRRANAMVLARVQSSNFAIRENEEKMKSLEYERESLLLQFNAERERVLELQLELDSLESEQTKRTNLIETKAVMTRQRDSRLSENAKLRFEIKGNAQKIQRLKTIEQKTLVQMRTLKLEFAKASKQLKETKQEIIRCHQEKQIQTAEIYGQYEELIAKERSRIASLRQLKRNFRIEVDSTREVIKRLECQQISIREIVSKQSAEIDELQMQVRIVEEKKRIETVFRTHDRNRKLCALLESAEQNQSEIASLVNHNYTVQERTLRPASTRRSPRTRIFTNRLTHRTELRPF